jgi:hypothetical protein
MNLHADNWIEYVTDIVRYLVALMACILSQFGGYRRLSDPERMLTDGRDQSRERDGPESTELSSWSSSLQTRGASASRPHSRNGKDRETPSWLKGGP